MTSLSKTLFLLLAISLFACDDDNDAVRGTGPVITRTLDIDDIRGFEASGSFSIVVAQAATQEITVAGQANLIDILSTRIDDGVWRLRFTENVRDLEDFTVFITVPTLTEITLNGANAVRSEGDLAVDALSVTTNGSAAITLTGTVDTQTLRLTGSSAVRNFDFVSRETVIVANGSSVAQVTATEVLNASANGSSSIQYQGNPATLDTRINGSGSISQR